MPLLLFSDLGVRYLDEVLCFSDCGAQTPAFAHVAHIQGQVHVGLFLLYTTSLPCHRSRHVDYRNHIRFHSVLSRDYSLVRQLPGMFVRKFAHEIPRADVIMMFNFADFADKCLGRPWRFLITGSNRLVM
jgi:hypothetical protein